MYSGAGAGPAGPAAAGPIFSLKKKKKKKKKKTRSGPWRNNDWTMYHLMILSVHKEKTDLLDINQLGNVFGQGSDHRLQQLGTSKKWPEILRSHSSFHKTHTSNDMYQKNFKVNQQLFWWLPDWVVSGVELQELKFGGFSHLKFQKFSGGGPPDPLSFCLTNAKYLPAPLMYGHLHTVCIHSPVPDRLDCLWLVASLIDPPILAHERVTV